MTAPAGPAGNLRRDRPGRRAGAAVGTDADSRSGPWAVPLVVLVAGMFMSVLDVSIVNVAIPAMQIDFGATTDDIQWVATAYSLALGVVVPASAWLGDRLGLKRPTSSRCSASRPAPRSAGSPGTSTA